MGQAKQRGTFEQRKAEGEAKRAEAERKRLAAISAREAARTPQERARSKKAAMMLGMVVASSSREGLDITFNKETNDDNRNRFGVVYCKAEHGEKLNDDCISGGCKRTYISASGKCLRVGCGKFGKAAGRIERGVSGDARRVIDN